MAPVVAHFYLAVHVFFVLSAFALAYSATQSPTGYGAYLVKRFFRIAPLFYVLVAWAIYRGGWPDWATLAANLTFTFNLVPGMHLSLVWAGWSVGVEMLFYLVFPFLLMSLRPHLVGGRGVRGGRVILDGLLWALGTTPASASTCTSSSARISARSSPASAPIACLPASPRRGFRSAPGPRFSSSP